MSTNSTRKVILLGFDGMDFDLTSDLIKQGHLPNLKKLADSGGFSPLLSVFPPDSIPSWITVYTGLNPSEHGILEHVNYLLDKKGETSIDTSVFHKNILGPYKQRNRHRSLRHKPIYGLPGLGCKWCHG